MKVSIEKSSDGRVVALGDEVWFHYRLAESDSALERGSDVESSHRASSVRALVGAGELLEHLERSIIGMRVGSTFRIALEPSEFEDWHLDEQILGSSGAVVEIYVVDSRDDTGGARAFRDWELNSIRI